MHRLLPFLACVLIVLTTWGGTASATDAILCEDVAQAMQMQAGDDAIVSADADHAYPHRHARCHGHDVAAPLAAGSAVTPARAECAFRPLRRPALAGSNPDQTLRPPQA